MRAGVLSAIAVLFVLVLSFSLIPGLFAKPRSLGGDPAAPLPEDPALTFGTLPGGLSYYLRPTRFPEDRILFRLVVAAGSMDETGAEAGYAHFVEHMAFNGTDAYPGNALDDLMASLDDGMDLEMNAFTYPEYTVYLLEIPVDRVGALELGVGILRQWAFALRFEKEEVEREKGVIRAESREYDTPEERQRQMEDAALYTDSPPSEWGILGTRDSVDAADPAGLRAYYRRCYVPERMAVVIAGPFAPAEARRTLETVFLGGGDVAEAERRPPRPLAGNPGGIRVKRGTDNRRGRVEMRLLFRESAEPLSCAAAFLREYRADAASVVLAGRLADLGASGDRPWIFLDADRWAERCGERLWEIVVSCPPGGETATLRDLGLLLAALKVTGASAGETETACREAARALPSSDPDGYEIADAAERSFLYGDAVLGGDAAKALEPWLRDTVMGNGAAALGAVAGDLPSFDDGVLSVVSPAPVPLSDADLCDAFLRGLEDGSRSLGTGRTVSGVALGGVEGVRLPEVPRGGSPSVASRSVRPDEAVELVLSNGLRVFLKATDSGGGWAYLGAWSPGGLAMVPEGGRAAADEAPEILRAAGYPAASPAGLRAELSGTSVAWTVDVEAGCERIEADGSSDDLDALFRLVASLFSPPAVSARAVENAVLAREEELRLDGGPEAEFRASVDAALGVGSGRIHSEDLAGLGFDQTVSAWTGRFGDASDFVFAAAGDFDLREAERLAVSVLGRISVHGGREPFSGPLVSPKAGRTVIRAAPGARRGGVAAVWRLDGLSPGDASDLDVLARGLEVRLFRKLREELASTYDVVCRWYPSPEDPGSGEFLVEFGSSPESARASVDELFREIRSASAGENPGGWGVGREQVEPRSPDDETAFRRLLAEARGTPPPPEPPTEPGAGRLAELASRWLAPDSAAVFVLGF